MKKFLLFLAVSLTSACGRAPDVNVNNIEPSPTNCDDNSMPGTMKYQYEFKDRHCSTGCHVSYSFKDYCAQLKDDALNHYCAEDARKEAFEQSKCPH